MPVTVVYKNYDPCEDDADEKNKKNEWNKLFYQRIKRHNELFYPSETCKLCRKLNNREPEPMSDVNDYLLPYQLDEDEGAKLRIARYYKMLNQTGGFEIECAPCIRGLAVGFIFNSEHFRGEPNFQSMLNKSVQFAVDRYNQETGNQMELLKIQNVTVEQQSGYFIFFVTFESFEPLASSYVNTYQTVVSFRRRDKTRKVEVFRRKSDGQDLLTPDPMYDDMTRVEK